MTFNALVQSRHVVVVDGIPFKGTACYIVFGARNITKASSAEGMPAYYATSHRSSPSLAGMNVGVHMLCNGRSKLSVVVRARGSSPSLITDLMLGRHQAALDPNTRLLIRADRVGIEKLGKSSFDLLIEPRQLVDVLRVRDRVSMRPAWLSSDRDRRRWIC